MVSPTSMGRGSIGFPLRGGASGCVVRLGSSGQGRLCRLPCRRPGHGLKAARGAAGAGPVQGAGAAAGTCTGGRFAAMLLLSIAAADKILYGR